MEDNTRTESLKLETVHEALLRAGYCSNRDIGYAVFVSAVTHKPLLIEGAPGVGKTSLAKAIANGFGLEFVRVQMYDGLTDDKILYDYDYQRQLLTLEAVKPVLEKQFKGEKINDIIQQVASELDFYGPAFLIERPILRAINGQGRKVLLIDEIDKAPEEIEYMLYEFLEDYSITIPQYGTVSCPAEQIPAVFITSNCYRNLSNAFKRRCNYLYIDKKTVEEVIEILRIRAGCDENIAVSVAKCLDVAGKNGVKRVPSISEGVEWAKYLMLCRDSLTKEIVQQSISLIAKNNQDRKAIAKAAEEAFYGG